ncbi:MAG: hypothetical protein J6B89_00765 [Bacilli bacterium]|nr:hypothetical protein [Bacilli bacterium]
MKKVYMTIMMILFVFSATACSTNSDDALKFKDEYESMNGVVNEKTGKKTRSISIPNDNPIVYKSADDIVDAIENKETFVVYFGFSTCPWCRSVIEEFMDVLSNVKIKNVYYVDVKEIRDILSLDDSNNVVIDSKGSDGYYRLLKSLNSVLDDYKLYDRDNNVVLAGEKRIYAPNIIYVKKGKIIGMTDGVSDKQTDGYMDLTDEMRRDSYNIFKELLDK